MASASVEGVILAAGLSRRTGRHKMTLPLGGKTVIEHTIAGMAEVVERIHVVIGHQAERLRELLAGRPRIELVMNEGYQASMFSSVKAGIARVRAERFFLLPGDYPLVGADVYRALLRSDGEIVIPTFQGRKGHPVLLRSGLIPEILAQPPDATLRDYIVRKGYVTVKVADEGILLDIDTLDDYYALVARWTQAHGE